MKVLEKLTMMVSTGGTDVPLILGTSLHHIMEKVVNVLNENSKNGAISAIYYSSESTIYSEEFYDMLWNLFIQPVIMDYYKDKPSAWFLSYYKFSKDLN